eukprot:CAMPEP_0174362950 /NCGR_PEP_ID=MMETSP0811_2-20130205/66743_1 /TAXON_ID=73025 ORGANISM="Eutreptiella gymnastica-like, Strain CCMP1594" /NCGR_SAMPLE_ID=MMETSP0811_2 /ASSEMBLY_ACC=CAM_ASM_000667 /LENGTH=48 /DNA_ID= /DNA_START= /DNA_END= /DNA_ORIENTATION=
MTRRAPKRGKTATAPASKAGNRFSRSHAEAEGGARVLIFGLQPLLDWL